MTGAGPEAASGPAAASSGEPLEACTSCGEPAMRRFCAECGERRRSETDYSLLRFASHAFRVITNVDSTVGRSFSALVLWPGRLTAEHFAGRRRPYVDPVQLFLVCNVAFFGVTSFTGGGPFTTSLENQLLNHPYGSFLQSLPTGNGTTFGELLDNWPEFQEYARTYDTVTGTLARSLIVLMVPLFAVVSFLLFGRSARYAGQHLVFALHFWAYVLLLFPVVGLAVFAVQWAVAQVGIRYPWQVWDLVISSILLVVFVVYLAEAGRRAFGETLMWTLPKAVVLGVSLLPIVFVYRFVLFFATLAAI